MKHILLKATSVSPRTILLFILLSIILSYSNTFYSPFVLDDFHTFINARDTYASHLSLESITNLASTSFGIARFIPLATFAVDHNLSSRLHTGIAQYHITNILIHLLSTIAVFLFIKKLLSNTKQPVLTIFSPSQAALLVCSLWALNPVQTNAVTYIVQRMASLATLFYVSTLIFYLSGRKASSITIRTGHFIAATLSGSCALLSKENSLTLPLAILLIEIFFLGPTLPRSVLRYLRWKYLAIALLLIVLLAPIFQTPLERLFQPYSVRSFTLSERLLTESRVVVFYLSLLVLPLPSRMNLEHDFTISHSLCNPPETLVAIILLSSMFSFAFYHRKRYPIISFGIIWFFLNLMIESTVIPLEIAFEHRLYLPSIGFFIAIVGCTDVFCRFLQKTKPIDEIKQLMFLLGIIAVSVLSVLTTIRNNDWQDTLTIAHDSYKKSPSKARALTSYGVALARMGHYDESINILEKAIAVGIPGDEDYLLAASNILVAHIDKGKYSTALQQGKFYLKNLPPKSDEKDLPKYLHNLCIAYYKTEQYSKAYEALISSYTSSYLINNGRNTWISDDLLFLILSKIYEDRTLRKEFNFAEDSGSTENAIWLKTASVFLRLRMYENTQAIINRLAKNIPNHSQVQKLQISLRDEIEKNDNQARLMNIKGHGPYLHNMTYRFAMASADFIMNRYRPLTPFVGNLLNIAQKEIPQDPFIALYRIQWHSKMKQTQQLQDTIEASAKTYPDFIPILEMARSLYLNYPDKKEKVREISQIILSLYPAHPNWVYFQKNV